MAFNKLQTESHRNRVMFETKTRKRICRASFSGRKIDSNKSSNKNEPKNRDYLIRRYAYLVNWIVNRLPVSTLETIDKDDLNGYGIIGLIEAVDRFDPTKNTSFESFAVARIRGSIYDYLRASDWLTRGARKRVKNLVKVSSILENKLGRYPNDIELAKELSVSQEELREIQREAQISIFSLDEPRDSSHEDSAPLVENVSSDDKSTFLDNLEEIELRERLAKAISTLPEKEKTVVGLYHYKKLTFKEIAEVMDFSESRASQIHARAISLLKSKMLRD